VRLQKLFFFFSPQPSARGKVFNVGGTEEISTAASPNSLVENSWIPNRRLELGLTSKLTPEPGFETGGPGAKPVMI